MGLLDNFKAFVHSITTDDHYASYDSPYRNSMINDENTIGNSSRTNLNELNNGSNISLNDSTNGNGNNKSSVFINYRPGLRSSNTNLNGSDLQLQTLNRDGQPPLPSIDSLWDRFESWVEEEYPELEDYINDGVTTADLNEFENDLKCGALPVEFRQFYKRHDGQFRGGTPTGIIMGLSLLDLEGIVQQHAIWSKVAERIEKQKYMIQQSESRSPKDLLQSNDSTIIEQEGTSSIEDASKKLNQLKLNNSFISNQRSIPPNSIQPVYTHKGWISIIKDEFGNQIAIDLAPGPQGNWGQVIIFGRDFDTKLVIASNLQEFMFQYVTDLESGNFKIDQNEIDTSYGYLESSRNDDDYYIGDEDEGQGELSFWDKEKEFGTKPGEPLTYLEVLKRRTLKRYGITNVEKFLTSFVPQQYSPRLNKSVTNSKVASPLRSAANSTTDLPNNLINVDSTSKVNLPKETIIDEPETSSEVKPDATVDETDTTDIVKADDIIEDKPEEPERETSKKEEEETEETEVNLNAEVKESEKKEE